MALTFSIRSRSTVILSTLTENDQMSLKGTEISFCNKVRQALGGWWWPRPPSSCCWSTWVCTEEPCELPHRRFIFRRLICFLTLSLRPHLMMHLHLGATWPPLPRPHSHILSQQALRQKPRPPSPVTSSSSCHILWKQWEHFPAAAAANQITDTNASTEYRAFHSVTDVCS